MKLKDDRFMLLARFDTLPAEKKRRVRKISKAFPLLGKAHQLKEAYFDIWECKTARQARLAYKRWVKKIPPELMPAFQGIVTAMKNWQKEIFTYFDQPITNAFTELANNLIRGKDRVGRGYSFDVLRAKMLFAEPARVVNRKIELTMGGIFPRGHMQNT